MADPRFLRLQSLFDAALARPQEEQAVWATAACDGDPALRDELLQLLAWHRGKPLIADAAIPTLDAALRDVIPGAFPPQRRAGPFVLQEAIGDGGMGRVYRGVRDDGEVEQEVAIKLVRAELLNPALLARFSLERRLLASLDHPNICRFLDAGTLADGTPYVAMERVNGKPLLEYCSEHRLGLPDRVRLLRHIAAAIAHAHRRLIVHRDIKSSNVLVDDGGQPKLVDFGIATVLDADAHRTRTAERFLTPANAAPEQLRGEPTGVGCDIYALGLLTYEVLCGRAAFDLAGLRAGEIEQLLLHVPPSAMSQRAAANTDEAARERGFADASALKRALRHDLDAVVATSLRKRPDERYPSVEQFDAELERWLEQRPVLARRGDGLYRLRKFVARHRMPVALAAALALSVVGGVSLVGWQALRLADERNAAVLERDRAQEVVALLQHAFSAADPARVSGDEVRARDVLAAARPRLAALRDSRTELYAGLAATVADVELSLGLDADAASLAADALEAARAAGLSGDAIRSLLRIRAEAATSMGQTDVAQAALDRMAGFDSAPRADWMVATGRLLQETNEFDAALAILRRAQRELASRGPDDELATRARWETIQTLRRREAWDEALAVLDATLAWQREALPEHHARVALSRLQRVDLLRQSGRLEAAAAEATAVHRDLLAAYGDRSAMAARSGAALGMALYFADRIDEGVEVYREARHTWIRALGETHPQTLRATFNLARMLEPLPGRENEVRRLFEAALHAAETREGPHANTTIYMRLGLARWLVARQEWDAALGLLSSQRAQQGIEPAQPANRAEHQELLRSAMLGAGCGAPVTPPCRAAKAALTRLEQRVAAP